MPLKIFIYAQDNRGLGHVTRCLTLARTLLELRPDAAVLLATKSARPGSVSLGDRFDFLKLPAQLTLPASAEDERSAESAAVRALRRALLREAVQHFQPRLVLADNEPLGFGGELIDALAVAPRNARLVFGMRDVVDDPARTAEAWQRLGVLEALSDRFDRILVYGHPELFDTLATYDLPEDVRAKAAYSGYVCSPREVDPERLRAEMGLGSAPFVLVTGGGGEDALPLLAAAVAAVPLLSTNARPRLLLVTGPFMPGEDRVEIARLAGPGGHLVREFVDVPDAMTAAQAVVTMGGYNTLAEALMLGRRPIVVPRATHKREQLLRAHAFAQRGLAYCLPPAELTPERLAATLDAELGSATRVDAARYLDLHGRRAAVLLLETLP